ncbi:AAA domain-containing protein [Aspergillus pseudoustus]|uniref:AAA domain-containing protein n=1 Tax=Aspergillus pseudoustus TaxID=1810923 RepID=A0ABR4KSE0_9EURO
MADDQNTEDNEYEEQLIAEVEAPSEFERHIVPRIGASNLKKFPAFAAMLATLDVSGNVVEILGSDQDEECGIKTHVCLTPQSGAESYVEVKHRITYSVPGMTGVRVRDAHLYLTHAHIVQTAIKQVIPQNQTPTDGQILVSDVLLRHGDNLSVLLEKQRVWQLSITLRRIPSHSSNLFSNRSFYEQDNSMSLIRDYYRNNVVLTLFVMGPYFDQAAESLLERLDQDSQKDPYNEWYPKHPEKHFLQVGDYATPEQRPQFVDRKAKNSFANQSEYVTALGYAAIYEQEHHDKLVKELENRVIPLVTMTIPRAGNKRYFGFLRLPAKDDGEPYVELYPGDKLKVAFNYNALEADPDLDWGAQVLEPLPMSPPGYVPIMLTRRYKPEVGWLALQPELQPLDLSQFPQPLDAMSAINTAASRMVKIRILNSDQTFRQSIDALHDMTSDPEHHRRRLLLSNNLSSLQKVNMYDGISGDHDILSLSFTFNREQVAAYEKLKKLPGGVGLFQGPPGTGKTHWALRIALPIVTNILRESQARRQVMLVGPSNNVVDHLARSMSTLLIDSHPEHEFMVTRCHSLSTEETHVLQRAGETRPRPPNARPPILDDSLGDDESLLTSFETASIIAQMHAESTAFPSGVADRRLKELHLSLSWRMLQMAGYENAPWSEERKYLSFRTFFDMYSDGEDLSQEDMTEFRKHLRLLRDDALTRSDVVVSTAFAAGRTPIRQNVTPHAIIVDEAARYTEPDLWPVLAWYRPRALLLVGEHHQLKPFVFTGLAENPLTHQLQVSLFSRLYYNGLMEHMFRDSIAWFRSFVVS